MDAISALCQYKAILRYPKKNGDRIHGNIVLSQLPVQAALVARCLWAGPSGLRVAGGQAGPRARTGGRMRARGNMCIKFLSLNYRWNYFVFGQKLLYLGFEHRQIGGNRIPDFI